MKSSAVIFCLIALGSLGESQKCNSAADAASLDSLISGSSSPAGDGTSGLGGSAGDSTSGLGDSAGDSTTLADLQTLENSQSLSNLQTDLNNNLNDAIVQGGESIKDLAARSRLSQPLLSKRADLVCTADESCFSAENEFYCVNLATGDVRNAAGETANFLTGESGAQTGDSQTTFPATDVPAATKATTANRSSPTNTDDEEDSDSTSPATSAAAATDSPSSTDASPTSRAPALTSALNSIRQSGTASSNGNSRSGSGSGSTSTSTPSAAAQGATPGNGASTLEFSSTAMMSMIAAASLLWRILVI